MTTVTEPAILEFGARRTASEASRLPHRLGAACLVMLPALLTVYLSFNSGGYFSESQGAAAAVLAGAVAVRMAIVRHPFAGFSRPLTVAVAALAIYSVWSLVSANWSHAPARALLDFNLANVYLFVLILFGSSARSDRRTRSTVWVTGLSMLAVCAVALATRLRPDLFPIPGNLGQNRLSFPLTYWNALGIFAVIAIILALHLASSTQGPRSIRVFASAAIPIFAVVILLTFSRAALVLGVGGLLAYALLARPAGLPSALLAAVPPSVLAVVETYQAKLIANAGTSSAAIHQGRHLTTAILVACGAAALLRVALLGLDAHLSGMTISLETQRKLRLTLAVGSAVTACGLIIMFGGQIAHQWNNFTSQDSTASTNDVRSRIDNFSVATRLPVWRIALHTFDRYPLHGHGAGTFAIDYVRGRSGGGVALETHSLYLEAMSELGLIGLGAIALCVLAVVGGCFLRARRSPRSLSIALGIIGVVWAVHAGVDWDWEMPAVTLPVFALAACGLARRGGSSLRPRTETILRIAVGVVALAVAYTALQVSLADNHLSRSVAAFNTRDCRMAVAEARATITAVPSRPQSYEVIGYCDTVTGRPALAIPEMRRAISEDPQNWRYLYGLAIAQAAAGQDPRPALRSAEALDPLEPLILTAASAFTDRNRRSWRQVASSLDMPVSTRE